MNTMNEPEDGGRLRRDVSLPEGVALVAVAVAFTYVGGLVGGALGVALVGARRLASPVTVYALGHVLGLVIAETPTLQEVAVLEAPLVLALLAAGVDREAPDAFAPAMVVAVVGLALVAAGGLTTFDSLWQTAALGTLVVGLVAYGLHRYELVRLGLVSEST